MKLWNKPFLASMKLWQKIFLVSLAVVLACLLYTSLPQELPTEGEPDGCDPDVGDFCLYAPWGNLSVFYQDFQYSDSLILLGHIDSGMELLSGQSGDFSATLEVAE